MAAGRSGGVRLSRYHRRVEGFVSGRLRCQQVKAESTGFEHEADALTAKAQELMARYAIGEAVANGGTAGRKEKPSLRRVAVDDSYASPKAILLSVVMAARQARESAEQELGRDLLPLLAGRREEVDDYTARLFPHLVRTKGTSVTNEEGWLAGRAAAERGPWTYRE